MLHTYIYACCLLIVLNLQHILAAQILSDDSVLIDITKGTLKGRSLTTEAGVKYYSFQGIPYAKPPVGELRFKAPQSLSPWEGIRDATQHGSVCPQVLIFVEPTTYVGEENCLFLNVYTTQLPNEESSPNLPVMVWIHGGAFSVGSGNTGWYGPDFLMNTESIVLVTINYRLGVLGYLGLNHTDVSKNNGLKDQVAALQWVKINIEKFGGNPNDVTIFGESAGGASVDYHVLSPLSGGYFHKAIAQSGSALNYWAYADPLLSHERALAVGEILDHNTSDLSFLLDSLMKAEPFDLVKAGNKVKGPLSLPPLGGVTILFTPTLETGENVFLPDSPVNIMKAGQFHKVPYIAGETSSEGKIFAQALHLNSSHWPYYEENFEEIYVPEILGIKRGSNVSQKIAAEIKEVYFGNESLSENIMEELVNLEGDSGIMSGIYRILHHFLSKGHNQTYFYVFSYEGKLSMSQIQQLNYSFSGASHGDEIGYLFKMYDFNATQFLDPNSIEIKVIQQITKLWTDFAKTGNPSINQNFEWSPLSKQNSTYLNIDNELTIENLENYKPEKLRLWDKIYNIIDDLPND